MKPYVIWGPPSSANPLAKEQKLPTANPPPAYVIASVEFDIVNRGTEDIGPYFNVSIANQNYTSIDRVSLDVAAVIMWPPSYFASLNLLCGGEQTCQVHCLDLLFATLMGLAGWYCRSGLSNQPASSTVHCKGTAMRRTSHCRLGEATTSLQVHC